MKCNCVEKSADLSTREFITSQPIMNIQGRSYKSIFKVNATGFGNAISTKYALQKSMITYTTSARRRLLTLITILLGSWQPSGHLQSSTPTRERKPCRIHSYLFNLLWRVEKNLRLSNPLHGFLLSTRFARPERSSQLSLHSLQRDSSSKESFSFLSQTHFLCDCVGGGDGGSQSVVSELCLVWWNVQLHCFDAMAERMKEIWEWKMPVASASDHWLLDSCNTILETGWGWYLIDLTGDEMMQRGKGR